MIKVNDINVPQLRFNEFDAEWKQKEVPELIAHHKGAMKIGPFGSQLKKDTFVKKGFKVYGQENIFIDDFNFGDRFITEEHFNRLKTNEIYPDDFVVSTMGTIGRCTVVPVGIERGIMDSHMIRLQLNENVITPDFLAQLFGSFKMLKQVKRLSVGGIMDGLSIGIMKELKFQVPNIPEQQKIAQFLTAVDSKLQQLNQKKELLAQYKKGVMQQLFSQQLRFKQDNGSDYPDWEEKRLGEIADRISTKNTSNEVNFVLTNSATQGVVSQQEYFDKEIVWDTTKPMGDMKRLMSMNRAESYGFTPKVDLKSGLEKTINWYINNENR